MSRLSKTLSLQVVCHEAGGGGKEKGTEAKRDIVKEGKRQNEGRRESIGGGGKKSERGRGGLADRGSKERGGEKGGSMCDNIDPAVKQAMINRLTRAFKPVSWNPDAIDVVYSTQPQLQVYVLLVLLSDIDMLYLCFCLSRVSCR